MAEDAENYVICLRTDKPSPFTDNLRGVCARCQCSVWYRPHVPRPHTLICMECFPALHAEVGGDIVVTAQTLAELAAYQRRN
jgi:hypothetical protein